MVSRVLRRGKWELLFNGYKVSILEDEKTFGDGWWQYCITLLIYLLLLNFIPKINFINFMSILPQFKKIKYNV